MEERPSLNVIKRCLTHSVLKDVGIHAQNVRWINSWSKRSLNWKPKLRLFVRRMLN